MNRNEAQQIKDVLDLLLPVQELALKATDSYLSAAERQELSQLVGKAVRKLLVLELLVLDALHDQTRALEAESQLKTANKAIVKALSALETNPLTGDRTAYAVLKVYAESYLGAEWGYLS